VAHVIAPDLTGAISQAGRMARVGGAEQQQRRRERAARDHRGISDVDFALAAPHYVHRIDAAAPRFVRRQTSDGRLAWQPARMSAGWLAPPSTGR
jgi:hypothetical protein